MKGRVELIFIEKICCLNRRRPFYRRAGFWIAAVTIIVLVKKISALQNDLLALNNELCFLRQKCRVSVAGNAESECISTAEESPKGKQPEPQADEEMAGGNIFSFIVNKSAKKYHTKFCSGVSRMAESKRESVAVTADTLEQAKKQMEDDGYTLCGVCRRGE